MPSAVPRPDACRRSRCRGLILLLALAACDRDDASLAPPAAPDTELFQEITRPGDGGAVHLVRLVQHGDRYAFEPAEISIASGEVVRFVMVGSQPESVAFDTAGLTPAMTAFVAAGRLHLGVLLTDPGAAYDVAFRDAPPGRYPFRSIPHDELGMRGVVIVRE